MEAGVRMPALVSSIREARHGDRSSAAAAQPQAHRSGIVYVLHFEPGYKHTGTMWAGPPGDNVTARLKVHLRAGGPR